MITTIALRDTDTCAVCDNAGLMLCPPDRHMATIDPQWDVCGNCDSEDVPELVTCVCQDA